MGTSMTELIRSVQRETGYPRFNFLKESEIQELIVTDCNREFTQYFPYKTLFPIHPAQDAVDPTNYPGLFRIVPDDAPIESIYDTGFVYTRRDLAVGGYARDMGRSVYGGSVGIGAMLYNQMNINMMSMTQAQQTTGEFVAPNMIQLWPKRNCYQNDQTIIIELLMYHSDDMRTIPNSYAIMFKDLCVAMAKRMIYDRYKDWEDETVAGHTIRTKVQNYSDMDSKIDDLREKMSTECALNPDRSDFLYII